MRRCTLRQTSTERGESFRFLPDRGNLTRDEKRDALLLAVLALSGPLRRGRWLPARRLALCHPFKAQTAGLATHDAAPNRPPSTLDLWPTRCPIYHHRVCRS